MASRTKDNLQVLTEVKATVVDEPQEEPVVDLKHLFTKHDRRVPHLPTEKIPDMLTMMKERQKQRHLAREEAKKAAAAEADAARMTQRKVETEVTEPDFKHKKISASSHATYGEKLHSASRVVQSKLIFADKSVESKEKVKKKSHAPPMSFEQLMVLAERKQAEPAVDAQPSNVPKKVSAEQEQRPMTQEENERQERRSTKEYQHWLKHGGPPPAAASGGKSRHQQSASKSHRAQTVTVDFNLSESDTSYESDPETDKTCNVPPQELNAKKSYVNTATNRLKDGDRITHKHSATVKTNCGKLVSSSSSSSQQSLEHSRPVSRGEVMFTKGKVMLGKGNEAGQNGKSKSLSDELVEKLMEERRKMADRGDAVPSLADMLQELLNKVRCESNSQDSTTKHSVPRGTEPSSSSTKSKMSDSERKVESFKSGVSRSQSAMASGTRPSSQYVAVNETVVDCVRDKSRSAKPVKPSDKRLMKSTWEEMYDRAKSKKPNHDRGILLTLYLYNHCLYFHCAVRESFEEYYLFHFERFSGVSFCLIFYVFQEYHFALFFAFMM